MGLFSKNKITEQVFVKGRKLKCSICDYDKFIYRKSQLNTRLDSFLILTLPIKKPIVIYVIISIGFRKIIAY